MEVDMEIADNRTPFQKWEDKVNELYGVDDDEQARVGDDSTIIAVFKWPGIDLEHRYNLQSEYLDFIHQLRIYLRGPGVTSHGLPILPKRDDFPGEPLHFDIEFEVDGGTYNGDAGPIMIRITRFEIYVIGFYNGRSWFEAPEGPNQEVHEIEGSELLPFKRSYNSLELEKATKMGFWELKTAINSLAKYEDAGSRKSSFRTMCVMVSEAVRFDGLCVLFQVLLSNRTDGAFDSWMRKWVKIWGKMSQSFHDEDNGDAFDDGEIAGHEAVRKELGYRTSTEAAPFYGMLVPPDAAV